ncbi:hypothetical protein [Lachnoclostridium phytofermentans]|uniref:hypothetical protein n=1 Tax=Lachnoclostridium phytofermentans TaxID=66219 RepID=UPI0004DF96D9|nr:hypothetical protein [Lachnoclostridium phytofermentans]
MRINNKRRVMLQSYVDSMKLKGKPKCPCCGNSLTYVYSDTQEGHINQKCYRCKGKVLIDLKTMETYLIVEDEFA